MPPTRAKAFGITLVTVLIAGCNIGEGPNGVTGAVPPPEEIIPPTPIYSGGIYDGVIDNISGSGSNCAINGNFGGLIDENGNAYLTDSNGCSFFSNNIGSGSVQLIPSPDPQDFFPEITGNFNIFSYFTFGGIQSPKPRIHSGAIVGGVSGPGNYCVSADVNGLNGNTPGTGATIGADPISHLWARATVSNDAPVDITRDGICGELLVTSDNSANQLVGFYSEQAPGLAGDTLYNKDSSTSLLEGRWTDQGNVTTITIDANGTVTDSTFYCQIGGTFTTDNPDINVYTAELDYGASCPFTFSGKGWLSADNEILTLIGTIDFGGELSGPAYTLARTVIGP